jgi:uncharacterized protein
MSAFYLGIGIAAGLLSGLFGIGGGIVIVPALALGMGMEYKRAVGTSIGSLLLPVGILAARAYWKGGNIDVRAAALIALGLTGGAWLSARYAQGLAPAMLQRGFAILLVVMAVRMWVRAA